VCGLHPLFLAQCPAHPVLAPYQAQPLAHGIRLWPSTWERAPRLCPVPAGRVEGSYLSRCTEPLVTGRWLATHVTREKPGARKCLTRGPELQRGPTAREAGAKKSAGADEPDRPPSRYKGHLGRAGGER